MAPDAGNSRLAQAVAPFRALSWPNRLTVLRLMLVIPFVMALLKMGDYPAARVLAMALFAVMALSDLLDGVIARKYNQRTQLGAVLDPLADKAMIICATIVLALPSTPAELRLPIWVVVAVVAKDIWVLAGCVVVFMLADGLKMGPSLSGKASTLAQAIMVALTLLAPELNRLHPSAGAIARIWSSAIVTLLCGLAVMSYTRMGLAQVQDVPTKETHADDGGH